MEYVIYKEKKYPFYQSIGFAAQFIFPYVSYVCKGVGYDIGCMKKEWAYPGAIPVDKVFDDEWDAFNLPESNVDYIFSSHCLEHIPNWVEALSYWTSMLKVGGILFLYLPHYDQLYWRPWHNRKHIHAFTIDIIRDCMVDLGYCDIYNSERDLNYSFAIFGTRSN